MIPEIHGWAVMLVKKVSRTKVEKMSLRFINLAN
jgi:hypothetical protein